MIPFTEAIDTLLLPPITLPFLTYQLKKSYNFFVNQPYNAGIAQLVEHLIRNEGVAGSNPVTSSKNSPEIIEVSGFYFWVVNNERVKGL